MKFKKFSINKNRSFVCDNKGFAYNKCEYISVSSFWYTDDYFEFRLCFLWADVRFIFKVTA
jgi:hypothetical protein